MANIVKMKQSSVAGKVPLTTDLALGELAINTRDGKLYLKKNVSGTETIVDVTAGGLLPASSSTLGGVKGLTNLTIDGVGNLSMSAANVNSALGYTPANAAHVFPSGTRMPFAQASAPTGWTQDVSDNADNRMLRVVKTTGNGIGGSHSPILNNVVPSHTHGFTTGTESADHSHAGWTGGINATHSHQLERAIYGDTQSGFLIAGGGSRWGHAASYDGGAGYYTIDQNGDHAHYITTGGRSAAHTHSGSTDNGSSQTNWTPRYIDMIICSKN